MLDYETDGAAIMLLNEGLARRSGGNWQYVCPALWGEEDITPAAVIPNSNQTVAIAGSAQLFLMHGDGTVVPHPAATAQVHVVDFATAGDQLFGLASTPDLAQVVHITPDQVEVIWTDIRPWHAIAGDANGLQLVRTESNQAERLALSTTGERGSHDNLMVPDLFLAVRARFAQGKLYLAAIGVNARYLGQIENGAWVPVCQSFDKLWGPVEVDGQLMVAFDDTLRTLDNGCAQAIPSTDAVIDLDSRGGHPFVCTKTGANNVSATGVGAPLFQLRDIMPPDARALPPDMVDHCCAQWTRYQQDLLSFGLIAATQGCDLGGVSPGPVGGAPGNVTPPTAGAADPPVAGALAPPTAISGGTGGSTAGAASPVKPPTQPASSGCQIATIHEATPTLLLALGALLLATRRRQRTSRRLG